VNGASVLDRLTARCGAAEAMHTDLEEEACGFHIVIQHFADDALLGDSHFIHPPFHYLEPAASAAKNSIFYYTADKTFCQQILSTFFPDPKPKKQIPTNSSAPS
jgi:hypothetical protein